MSKKIRNQLIIQALGNVVNTGFIGLVDPVRHCRRRSGTRRFTYLLEHWVYRFVERLEAQGRANDIENGIKPYSRKKIIDLLNVVNKKHRPELSPIELGKLDLLLGEFVQERAMFQYHARGGAVFRRLSRPPAN